MTWLLALLISGWPLSPIGALPQRANQLDDEQLRFITATPQRIASCAVPGVLCFTAEHAAAIAPMVDARFGKLTLIARGERLMDGGFADAKDEPWVIDLLLHFSPRNLRGTVVLLAYDRDDAHAVANHDVTQLWNLTLEPFTHVALRLNLDPGSSGFRRGHTYLFVAVQLLGAKQRVLSQGSVRLE